MPELRILRGAEIDLEEIWRSIAEDNIDIADMYLDKLMSRCRLLSENPLLGTERPELLEGLRMFPVDDYLIFYRPIDGGVVIFKVLHSARDIDRSSFD